MHELSLEQLIDLIDYHDKHRNSCVERLDELFSELSTLETPNTPQHLYASETIGSLINRISVTRLELYHAIKLDNGAIKHNNRIGDLIEQYVFLKLQAAHLLNDVRDGKRLTKIFYKVTQNESGRPEAF